MALDDLLRQTGTVEDPNHTIARFLKRLNPALHDLVRLGRYRTLAELVDITADLEKEVLPRCNSSRSFIQPPVRAVHSTPRTPAPNNFPTANDVPWQNVREHNGPTNKVSHPIAKPPTYPPTQGRFPPKNPIQGRFPTHAKAPIKCFQCGGGGHIKAECPSLRAHVLTTGGN